MTKTTFLAAATILTSLAASPVMAQDMSQQPTTSTHQRYNNHRDFDRHTYNDHRDSGFWPTDVAAGVVGGAVGAAGAIATAPFRNDDYAYNDSYAYDNDGCMNDGQKAAGGCSLNYHGSYAARNGFVCQPGTWIRMEDGRRHICQ